MNINKSMFSFYTNISSFILIFLLNLNVFLNAQTVPFHDRLHYDSLNLVPNNIRVNQVGYLPDDRGKRAFVTAYGDYQPKEGDPFYIIDAYTKEVVYEGKLKDSGYDFFRGSWYIQAYYNSITAWDPPYPLVANYGDEHIYYAEFGDFTQEGTFQIVCNGDTSWTFRISKYLFNDLLNTELKFLAFQRCGPDPSWAHGPCHTHDGDYLGEEFDGALVGGWHDCGDHPKFALTLSYTAFMLSVLSAVFEDKLNDQYNAAMNDTIFTDGIPDLMYEAYRGTQYILRLLEVSKKKGIWPDDMYHTVGDGDYDHSWWGRPEWQDQVPQSQGGRPRPVVAGAGAEVAAKFGAALAFFGGVWKKYDPEYAQKCIDAAEELYEYAKNHLSSQTTHGAYYRSNGRFDDEMAAITVGLLYATGDEKYKYDLLENTDYGRATSYEWNAYLFPGGWLAMNGDGGFYPGGWVQDWENIYAMVLYAFKKLILPDIETARKYNFTDDEYNNYSVRIAYAYLKNLQDGGLIADYSDPTAGATTMAEPYNLPTFSMDWGFNRYNLGISIAGFFFIDAFEGQTFAVVEDLQNTNECRGKTEIDFNDWAWLRNFAVRHLDYILGLNPWDVSFVMGVGTKNLNHPHNRTASAELLNNAAEPYDYTPPVGALMGGVNPSSTNVLKEDAQDYTVDETCVDYSMVLLGMTLTHAVKLPPDTIPPGIKNLRYTQVSENTELISWETTELSKDTLFLAASKEILEAYLNGNTAAGEFVYKLVSKKDENAISDFQFNHLVEATPLDIGVTYYFYIKAYDVKGNVLVDDNNGQFYSFTLTEFTGVEISDVTVCNITAHSATVLWMTNVPADSKVRYGTSPGVYTDSILFDDITIPTTFHRVTLENLQANTTYYFEVISGDAKATGTFTTEFEYANIQVLGAFTSSNVLWLKIVNKENLTKYAGLEVRVYLDKVTSTSTTANIWLSELWTGDNLTSPSGSLTFDYLGLKTDENGYKYLSIQISDKDTLYPTGKFVMKIEFQNTTEEELRESWSLRPHIDEDPYPYYEGIGPSVDPTTEPIRQEGEWAGLPAYLEDPYVVVYNHDAHIYGYYPEYDFENGTLHQEYDITINVTSPLNINENNYVVITGDDETYTLTIEGTVTVKGEVSGYGSVDRIIINGTETADFPADNNGENVPFTYTTEISEGVHQFTIVAWGDKSAGGVGCYFNSVTFFVEYKRGNTTPSELYVYDAMGIPIDKAVLGETQLYITVVDSDENVNETLQENVKVLITNPATQDSEWVTLPETNLSSGEFSSLGDYKLGVLVTRVEKLNGDMKISANVGDTIWVIYKDDDSPTDISIKKILVVEDIPMVYFTDSTYYPTATYYVNRDSCYVKIKDKRADENDINKLEVYVTTYKYKDKEKITLSNTSLYYYTIDKPLPIIFSKHGNAEGNGILEVGLIDTLYIEYTSPATGEKAYAKAIVIRSPEDLPQLVFTDSTYNPIDGYVRNRHSVYLFLKDNWTYMAGYDTLEVIITNKEGYDRERVYMILSGVNSYLSIPPIPIVFGTENNAKEFDGVINVGFDDTLYAIYISPTTEETLSVYIPIGGISVIDVVSKLEYGLYPNPVLLSQFVKRQAVISITYPDTTIKLTPQEMAALGIENLDITIYDINGNIVKVFNNVQKSPLTLSNLNTLLPIKYFVYWDGINKYGRRVQTGVYFIKFRLKYKAEEATITKNYVKSFYLINDMESK